MKKLILVFSVLLTTCLTTYLALPPKIPISPLSISVTGFKTSNSKYMILGFAPYWNLKKVTPEATSSITHLAYFVLHIQDDGSLYTHVNRYEEDPGYTNYKRLLKIPSVKPLILTFMPVDQSAMHQLLSSSASRAETIDTIINLVNESHAAGVNIDFEPVGDSDPSMRSSFTSFIQALRSRLSPPLLLTISIYPSAAIKPRLWDLQTLSTFTDYFVIMTYDYTMPGSTSAGPNSPLRDFGGDFEHDILKNLGELTVQVNSTQLLLGIPLYGYEWNTLDSTKYAPTTSRGATASLERIEKMLQNRTLDLIWDHNSLTPYGVSTASGTTTQIYFENENSIQLKLQLVKASGLGGIALWALGYENNVSWFWPTIQTLR